MERSLINRGWIPITFGDIASSMRRGPFGSNLKKSFFVPTGYKVYEQQNAINDDHTLGTYYINEKKFEELKSFEVGPGDYIVSCSGTIGKLSRLPKEAPIGVINQALLKITLNENLIQHKYFVYLFRSQLFLNKILKDARGTGIKNLAGITELRAVPIDLPPKSEQQKIVEKIDEFLSELDSGIANLKLAQEQLKVYRQAVLKKVFEGSIKVPFSDLVKSSQNGVSKRSGKEGNELKVLRLADISNLEIDYSSPRCIKLTSSEINKYKLLKDDLICIRVNGSKNLVGRLIITSEKDDSNDWAFCDHFIRFSLDLSSAVPKYYYYYFQTMEVRQYIHENMVSSAGQNTVSQGTIKSILVPFSSLSEQQVIVQEIETRLSVCDKIEQDIETNLERAEALRQSILKKAFEGKLLNEKELAEVRKVEDWESTEVLLEKIKAEREGNGKKGNQMPEQLKRIIQDDKRLTQQATLQIFEQVDK